MMVMGNCTIALVERVAVIEIDPDIDREPQPTGATVLHRILSARLNVSWNHRKVLADP